LNILYITQRAYTYIEFYLHFFENFNYAISLRLQIEKSIQISTRRPNENAAL
jgi:hypothetical protein